MGWWFNGCVGIKQFWWGISDKNNIHSFHLYMISGNRDEAWPKYLVWPIPVRFMLGWPGGTWPACCHWLDTGTVDGRCPIMSVLTQSYQCGMWFVCSTFRELAVSNLGQPLFYLSIMWSRCRNAYRDLWIMTIGHLGTNFSEILIEILILLIKEIHLKVLSVKWWPFCLCLNVLTYWGISNMAAILQTAP